MSPVLCCTYDNIGQLKTAKGWESGGSSREEKWSRHATFWIRRAAAEGKSCCAGAAHGGRLLADDCPKE